MRAVLLSSRARAGTGAVIAQVRATIARHATVVGEFDVNDTLPPDLAVDRAVVIGGDGSIMGALRQLLDQGTPVVGVNTGRLGFLAEFDTASLETHATAIFGAAPVIRQRMVLAVSVRAQDGTTRYEGLAVNDCVVTAGAPFRMIELALRLDGENGPEFLGDGIIIATPVGSTAYNASAGGPIVHPDVEAIIVTPSAAHSLAFRPVVVPSSLSVQARVVRANEGTTLVLDGHINVGLRVGDTVIAKRHHAMARIVARPDSSYWETLVDKMRWAESPNYRAPGA
ncbi:MAG: NAD(+)/NADH kinase [Planctomycetota bacterium]